MPIEGPSGSPVTSGEQTSGKTAPKRPEVLRARIRKTPASNWKNAGPLRNRCPEWDYAVSTAAARLNAGWVLEETRCNQAVAEELAALLCAYKA